MSVNNRPINDTPLTSTISHISSPSLYSPKSLNVFYQQQNPNVISSRLKSPSDTLQNLSQMYTNLMGTSKQVEQRAPVSHVFVNKSTNDIESEFANLTLSIEREIEKHKNINEYYGKQKIENRIRLKN